MRYYIFVLFLIIFVGCSSKQNQKNMDIELKKVYIISNNDMENITGIFNGKQFKSIVELVLNNGCVELWSQFWGYSPYITFGHDYAIYLCPDIQSGKFKNPDGHPNFPHPENKKEWYDVSNWTRMSINLDDSVWADVCLIENDVYIGSIINIRETEYDEYRNRLTTTIIPQIKELLK